jgi:hypothetical protein
LCDPLSRRKPRSYHRSEEGNSSVKTPWQTASTTHVLSSSLLVVHDTGRGGQDDLTERTGGQQEGDPVLDGVQGDVESGRDNTGLVQSTVELDDDLAASVVIDDFEFTDVAFRRESSMSVIASWLGSRERDVGRTPSRVDNMIHPPPTKPIGPEPPGHAALKAQFTKPVKQLRLDAPELLI